MSRVGAQDLHKETAALHFFYGLTDSVVIDMAFDIYKENILPGFALRGRDSIFVMLMP